MPGHGQASGNSATVRQLSGVLAPHISHTRLIRAETGKSGSRSASAARRSAAPPGGLSPTVRCGITSSWTPP